ncbi:MAG: biopolymer transporter ExbD [Methylococcales bacterium]|jgi:biopolymer transport protein ExbD|nr:biopolymer transporter ExbD [Methylococcales bacterium]MBT7411359.1 biopolymer transporter ExbD [Methylococcales bacterium]
MNLKTAQSEELELNLTPLIDVVFLLLIFFMVSTTFTHETQIKLQLPEAQSEDREISKNDIEVTVDAQGRYFVNQRQLVNTKFETLKKAFIKVAGNKRNQPFVISADANTSHQSVMTVLNAARQTGFIHITFATKEPTPGQ